MFTHNSIGGLLPIRLILPVAALVIGVAMAGPSRAGGTVVNVSLWDKGTSMEQATDLGFPADSKDMSKASMGIALSVDTVKAGETTFEVLNSSKETIHEMIVVRLKDPKKALPYDSGASTVDEERAGHLGEVSELEPGKTGALRLDLKPGNYLLFCNIAGHFMAGMWTSFTVK